VYASLQSPRQWHLYQRAAAQYNYIAEQLSALGIVYLHVVEGATGGPRDVAHFDYDAARSLQATYIANNGYTRQLAEVRLRKASSI
jgi:N-ethylmaleimide reductase